ncbi:DUF6634 family protein [Methylobacterium sp. 22177]|uniref:DUF6634 family protein n=1 Tax=Methylobacterium sp. 22177 TaxID=3453885 RepID=UPI003F842AB4
MRPLSIRDLARRRADASRDIDLLSSGWRPDARTLAEAPILSDYVETTYPGTDTPCLYGYVSGHPLLPPGPMTTSPILARGPGWIRTESRFYATRDPLRIPTKPEADDGTPEPVPDRHELPDVGISTPDGFVGF